MSTNKAFQTHLSENYEAFKCTKLTHRRFKHADIIPLFEYYKDHPHFNIDTLCHSVESREIKLVKYGSGPIQILLWSQMHGDEPTGTQALFDIFNFLATDNGFNELKTLWREKYTLHFVPMLNPDGAQVYKRHNAFDIDPNRDALALQAPETKALMQYRAKINAELAFNLHDQVIYYSVGLSPNPATIAFLSPAFNASREIDPQRAEAMKLIAYMNQVLQQHIPNQVARYSDAFEPRAFGDRMQALGTNTILIESGADYNDTEKQTARKMNVMAILSALEVYHQKNFSKQTVDQYFNIPENKKDRFHDLILRNVFIQQNNHRVNVDIAIRRDEVNNFNFSDFSYQSYIQAIGDLTGFFGLEEFDGEGATLVLGKKYPYLLENIDEFEQMNHLELWNNNCLIFKVENIPPAEKSPSRPAQFIEAENMGHNKLLLNENPSFFGQKNNQNAFAIVNGFLFFEEDILEQTPLFQAEN